MVHPDGHYTLVKIHFTTSLVTSGPESCIYIGHIKRPATRGGEEKVWFHHLCICLITVEFPTSTNQINYS